MVEEVHDIQHAEEPYIFRTAYTVHDKVDPGLEYLDVPFDGVLELFVGFTEPAKDLHDPEILDDSITVFDLGQVRE